MSRMVFRLRLAAGLQNYSSRWKNANLAALPDAALAAAESQIYADAPKGRTAGLRPTEIRERVMTDSSGHRVVEFDGGEDASFVKQFSRPAMRAVLKSSGEYSQMSRDVNMARINEIIRHRPLPQVLRNSQAGF
jgi:hypothetical protein